MKKVLFICYSFPPLASSASLRTLKFVKNLSDCGWKPVILTAKDPRDFYGSLDPSLLEQLPKEVKVYRVNSCLPRKKYGPGCSQNSPADKTCFLRRIINISKSTIKYLLFVPDKRIVWMFPALHQVRRILRQEKIELVFSTSDIYANHLLGWIIKKWTRLPWVVEFQDPWTQNPYRQWPNRLQKAIEEWLEKKIIKASDAVVSTTQTVSKELINQHSNIDAAKFNTITSGFDPADFSGLGKKRDDKFTITHVGSLYGPRTASGFLTAVGELLFQEPVIKTDLQIFFIGTSDKNNKRIIDSLVKRYSLDNVLVQIPRLAYRKCLEYVWGSDCLLLITDPGKGGEALIPAKLFEYFYAGLPILGLVPQGESAVLIKTTKSGVVVNPGDISSIKEATLNYYRAYKRGILKVNQDMSVINLFDRRKLTKKLASIFDKLLERKQ